MKQRWVFFQRLWSSIKLLFSRINEDCLSGEASSLTYQTFLAVVPFLAVIFGIAKGFGIEQVLEEWLARELVDQQDILKHLVSFSKSALQETQGGVLAGIGVLFFLFTAIRLLSSIELVFNQMWGKVKGRPWLKKTSDYLAIILICPFLLAVSSSLTIFLTTRLIEFAESIPCLETAQPLLLKSFHALSFVTSAMLFSIILYGIPCAPVHFGWVCVAGVVTAGLFQIVQSWYVFLQVHFTQISAIYGSFVAIPLFLVWLWISWLLVLIGGELVVFLQEKGWREHITSYQPTAYSQITVDIAVFNTIHENMENPVFLEYLITSLPFPIRAITHSLWRLERKGCIYDGGLMSRIVTTRAADSVVLSDLILPNQPSSKEPLQETLISWREQLVKNNLDSSISLFSQKFPIYQYKHD